MLFTLLSCPSTAVTLSISIDFGVPAIPARALSLTEFGDAQCATADHNHTVDRDVLGDLQHYLRSLLLLAVIL